MRKRIETEEECRRVYDRAIKREALKFGLAVGVGIWMMLGGMNPIIDMIARHYGIPTK